MRVMDELPHVPHGNTKYPWNEVKGHLEDGKMVELDPDEFGTTHARLYSAARSWSDRNGYKLSSRGGLLYLLPR